MMDKEELKKGLTSYVRQITVPDRRAGRNMYKCPLCKSGHSGSRDSNGAFSIAPDGITWKCFSCQKGGDIFKLIELYEGIDSFPEQMKRASEVTGIAMYEAHDNDAPQKRSNTKGLYKKYIEECKADVGKTDYLKSRGFDDDVIKRFSLGYDQARDRIVIPYDREGSYYATRDVKTKKYRKPPKEEAGPEPVYNVKALYTGKPCFVCESQLDAISILSVSNGDCGAVAIGGTGILKLLDEIKQKEPSGILILNFDNDDSGRRTTSELTKGLSDLGVKFIVSEYSDKYEHENKDANDYLRDNREQFSTDVQTNIKRAEMTEITEREKEKEAYNNYTASARLTSFLESIENGNAASYIPTGFSELDEKLDGGLYAGLYILGAVSSLGKTTLMLQIADQIAEQGHDVLYFSLEMAADELMSKSISRQTFLLSLKEDRNCNDASKAKAKTARGITTSSRYKYYSQEEKDLIKKAVEKYSEYASHIYIYEGVGDIGITEVKQKVEDHVRITGNVPVIFIDYLQILAPYEIKASDKQNTDKAVLELKRISRDYKTPVFAISSFNRDNYSSKVSMIAFKESGAIEYGSDVLIALQPEGMEEGGKAKDKNVQTMDETKRSSVRDVEAVILKNRNGRTNTTAHFKYYAMFNYFDRAEDAEECEDDDVPYED